MKKLSKEQEQKYVNNQGSQCPYCLSNDIEGGCYSSDGNWITMPVICNACGETWKDFYSLAGILQE